MHYAAGQLYAWGDHWARINESAKAFELTLPTEAKVIEALRTLVAQADLDNATLKLSLLKGADDSQLFVYSRPALPAPVSRSLWLDLDAPIFERSPLAGHKTHNYMEAMHRLELARARGYFDALRLDSKDRLAETTSANLFLIAKGHLYTPAADTGILPGVTRAQLLRCPTLRVACGHYTLADLQTAEALFVTNATNGIQAIGSVEGLPGGGRLKFDTEHAAFETIRVAYDAGRTGMWLR